MSDIPNRVVRPLEQLPITYFGNVVLAARHPNTDIYLSFRDLCEAIGLDRSSQIRRIRSTPNLQIGLTRLSILTVGGEQPQDFLALDKIGAWLLGANARRATPEAQRRLTHLQTYLDAEVRAAFARISGLPERSGAIEDLADLNRLDTALNTLSERQTQIEQSQDKARIAWRDLAAQVRELTLRLATLEQSRTQETISRSQAGYIYQLVQAWGLAKAERDPRLSRQGAFAGCWTAFKITFALAKYDDLPAQHYDEAIAFIQQGYRQTTGHELILPAQQGELDL